ncbi:Histone-lysine N-methyltransferase SETMAR [Habropoda laboriosa]|uniref:Histone-lysine N-methyltransferase SETMAR n=1 Tax=Habropoda laboriosa TaxID=597456 RepID=A0A0L7QSJ2_9HYME|nr:Histone-lysine N-methyltransferase SETMAR [Habropoda laboriosa]
MADCERKWTIYQHQIQVVFDYELKLGRNATNVTRHINAAFREGTVSEQITRCWFAKFRLGDTNL